MPARDTQSSNDALSSIPDSLSSAKDDWGTSSYRNSESYANGRRSSNSSQHCSTSVSNCNDAEDAMVSSPSRGRRKEPESSKQTKSSSLASTKLRDAAAKGSLHHTPTRLEHHSAHDEKSVERSQQSILNAPQTMNPAYRQSRFTDLSDSIGMTKSSYPLPSNTSRSSAPRSTSDNTSSYSSSSTSHSGETGSGTRPISSSSHSGEIRSGTRANTATTVSSLSHSSSKKGRLKKVSFANTDYSPDSITSSLIPTISSNTSNKRIYTTSVSDLDSTRKRSRSPTTSISTDVADYKYLEGKVHRDDEDYQRYITERIYIDRRSGCIVGDRTLLLKNGQKHKSLDPAPIHVQSLVEMTQQYDQESSPQSIHALLTTLLHQGTNDDMTTGLPGSSNDFRQCHHMSSGRSL